MISRRMSRIVYKGLKQRSESEEYHARSSSHVQITGIMYLIVVIILPAWVPTLPSFSWFIHWINSIKVKHLKWVNSVYLVPLVTAFGGSISDADQINLRVTFDIDKELAKNFFPHFVHLVGLIFTHCAWALL